MEKLILPIALLTGMREWVEYVVAFLHKWFQSLINPKQFLAPLFHPTDTQIVDALEFYVFIVALNLLIYTPFLLGAKSELAEKVRLLAASVVGQIFGAIMVLSWHFAFWLMGGGASFSGTYLVSVYAGAPYLLLVSMSALIMVGALPQELQPLALNLVTNQKAMQMGIADPRTNTFAVVVGGILSWVIMIWMTVVLFRCMGFIHFLSGWRLIVAIVLSLVISAVMFPVLKFILSIFMPPPAIPAPNPTPTEGGQ